MTHRWRRGVVLAGATALVLASTRVSTPGADAAGPARGAAWPMVVAWAWERPTDLRALDPRVGVAFYAQTIAVDADGATHVRPRRTSLHVARDARLVAVTRIESAPGARPRAGAAIADAAAAIVATLRAPQVVAVQIDYDATPGERPFYRRLLAEVRGRLPAGVPLSMTALASWCAGDRWLRDLPVDEIVPMLFRMGPADARFRAMARAPEAAPLECRAAIGTALDEPVGVRRAARRLYVFNAGAWTPATLRPLQEAIE
jgi:hypothetical protein